jgi:hypothetical protein
VQPVGDQGGGADPAPDGDASAGDEVIVGEPDHLGGSYDPQVG